MAGPMWVPRSRPLRFLSVTWAARGGRDSASAGGVAACPATTGRGGGARPDRAAARDPAGKVSLATRRLPVNRGVEAGQGQTGPAPRTRDDLAGDGDGGLLGGSGAEVEADRCGQTRQRRLR